MKIVEWTPEEQAEWDAWVASRPPVVADLCRRFPPNRLYLLTSSNHRVTVHSYQEDGTLQVDVGGEYNKVMFERRVFGVKPEELTECDLPAPGMPTGVVLTKRKDIDAFLKKVRRGKVQCVR